MPEYVKREKKLHIQSDKQIRLMIHALEQAYRTASPQDKVTYSRLLRHFEK